MRRPDLVDALGLYLLHHCVGRENAQPWWSIRLALQNAGVEFQAIRRYQEAAEVLLDRGFTVVGLSSSGVFLARTVDELDAALGECERRARRTLTRRRRLRAARMVMLGQTRLTVEGA